MLANCTTHFLNHCNLNSEHLPLYIQIMDHPISQTDQTAKDRFTSEEARAVDRLQLDMYNEVRLAAEAHRLVASDP